MIAYKYFMHDFCNMPSIINIYYCYAKRFIYILFCASD